MTSRAAMVRIKKRSVDWETLIGGVSGGTAPIESGTNRNIFRQGDPADSVFYLRRGRMQLRVTSGRGKEANVAVLSVGEFFGEGCLAGQPWRMSTATTTCVCTLMRIEKPLMARMLHEQRGHLGNVCQAFAFPEHPIRRGHPRPDLQLLREASGWYSLAASSLWQGVQIRNRASPNQSKGFGGNGRHIPGPGQPSCQQVQEAWLY